MTANTRAGPGSFAHPALLYRTQQEYLDRLVPFIDTASGRDLFVVNAAADLVRIYTSRHETTIHAHLRRAA